MHVAFGHPASSRTREVKNAAIAPVRVAIRGFAGLLGSRLALAINKMPDMRVSAGIVKKDPTLAALLKSVSMLPENIQGAVLPETLYLDEKHAVVREVNSHDSIVFAPADQMDLSKECDVLVDASAPVAFADRMKKYSSFQGPILLQSGDYPNGRLITAPLIEPNLGQGNLYRQGDCILCGVVPVLAHLVPVARSISMHILTQYTDKLIDYPTDIRLSATYLRDDVGSSVAPQLASMLGCEAKILGVSQVPGLSYYTITVLLNTNGEFTGTDITNLLEGKPRIKVLYSVNSTYEIEHFYNERLRETGLPAKPIYVILSDSAQRSSEFRLVIALNYKPLVALSILDSIRALTTGVSLEEAMRINDNYLGLL